MTEQPRMMAEEAMVAGSVARSVTSGGIARASGAAVAVAGASGATDHNWCGGRLTMETGRECCEQNKTVHGAKTSVVQNDRAANQRCGPLTMVGWVRKPVKGNMRNLERLEEISARYDRNSVPASIFQ